MPSQLHRYDEPGHIHFWTICCYRRLQFFHDDGMKQVVIDALLMLKQRMGVCIIGYVIMPEHIHILVYPHRRGEDTPIPISKVLQQFKQFIGRNGKERLRNVWRAHGRLWSGPLSRWAHGEFNKQDIMSTRGYDRNISSGRELHQKLDYCHKNPITRGLAAGAVDWPWSSYRFCEHRDSSVIAWTGMDAGRLFGSNIRSGDHRDPTLCFAKNGAPLPTGKILNEIEAAQTAG